MSVQELFEAAHGLPDSQLSDADKALRILKPKPVFVSNFEKAVKIVINGSSALDERKAFDQIVARAMQSLNGKRDTKALAEAIQTTVGLIIREDHLASTQKPQPRPRR